MEDSKDHRKAIITFLAVAIIAVIVVAAVVASPKKNSSSNISGSPTAAKSTTSNTGNSSSDATTPATNSSTGFKDGKYVATGSYLSPGGNESITVHVTLASSVVTATSADSGAHDPEASEYQQLFISGYKSQVVGKKIDSISLSRVSGSSLTSQGFNEAIRQIENEAKA